MPTRTPHAPDAASDELNGHASRQDAVINAMRSYAHRRAEIVPVARILVPTYMVPALDADGNVISERGEPKMVPFAFRLRRLQRAERLQCEDDATSQETDPRFNNPNITRDRTDRNLAELNMLYRATVREDRERFWDSQEMQADWGVGSGPELIGAILGDRQQMEAVLALHALGDGIEQERARLKVPSANLEQ